jgi:hypothetical protein
MPAVMNETAVGPATRVEKVFIKGRKYRAWDVRNS